MKKLLIVAAAALALAACKFTYYAPASAAPLFGCTNVWIGNKLIKTGTCNLSNGTNGGKEFTAIAPDHNAPLNRGHDMHK